MEEFDNLQAQGLAARGDLFGEPDVARKPAAPIIAPALSKSLPFPEPGIYFGMPEADYHAVHAVSASGLKKMASSSMDYWATSPHLNPDYEERQNQFLDYGKAVHCFVLEGEAEYLSRYVVDLDPADYADQNVLISTDQIKAAISAFSQPAPVVPKGNAKQALIDQLADLGEKHGVVVDLDGTVPVLRERIAAFIENQPVKPVSRVPDTLEDGTEFMRPAVKEDWIDQLLELDPGALVWDKLRADHYSANAGKVVISAKDDRRIRIAAKMILGHDEIGKAFTGGFAEVSVFWYCRETGVPMKARFDYLKMRAVVDLKSFSNQQGMPVDRAIERAIASYRYNIQHAHYVDAVQAAKAMLRDCTGRVTVIGGDHSDAEMIADWCHKWSNQKDEPGFIFVFQQSGIAPVTRGKIMPTGTVYSVTRSRMHELKLKWAECAKTFGTDPWLDIAPISEIEDEAIPLFATEI